MRRFALLLLLAVPSTAAEYKYIVPAAGVTFGFNSQYRTEVIAVNPNAVPATFRVSDIYLLRPTTCIAPSSGVIAPGAVEYVFSGCFDLHAMVITSDQPLRVFADVHGRVMLTAGLQRIDLQQIDVATEWLPAGTDVLFPQLRIVYPGERANLFIVNPNEVELTVDIHSERPELNARRDLTITVAPRSLALVAAPAIPTPIFSGPDPVVVSGIHHVTVRANGKFYAGVSMNSSGDALFRAPVPLQR